ncbi:MAG: hypothetical protein K0S23_204 [Fluviicola sp.]|jgi:hypothetical protein|uniref:hypothetical protein n=1 Tax=Fluviicola sp. TaxID=1917219 RepID=UPI002610D12E|nr:hypothetical protein [Fluviicola sp.]MDF3025897.1 hypothetical protein [Fluviicola sp.]
MKEHLKLSFIGIAAWWMLLLPFDYALFDGIFKLIQKPFTGLLKAMDQDLIFETDTYGTYVLVALSFLLGVLSSPLINRVCKKWKLSTTEVLRTILAAILFFFLFKYGWDKITKAQFYLPEPNTLSTPFGKLSKDIAYWSLAGSSFSYTVILGIIEVLAAVLLLFKRTRFLASLISIAIFGQVVLINFSFDISVKLLSGSLLLFSLIYSLSFYQNWKGVFGFSSKQIQLYDTRKHRVIKYLFALLVIADCIYPTLASRNFNDDQFPRLAHHGAYRVYGNPQIKYLFIHRQHYLILQSQDDLFKDYKIDTHIPHRYTTLDGEISCKWDESLVIIQNKAFKIKRIPFENLPLLQESFHLFSDEFH